MGGLEQGEGCAISGDVNGELEVLALFTVALGLIGGMSSDDEKDIFSSDEEGEHNVENLLVFSFAHPACSPLMQGFLHGEELCKVALICHFSLDVTFLC